MPDPEKPVPVPPQGNFKTTIGVSGSLMQKYGINAGVLQDAMQVALNSLVRGEPTITVSVVAVVEPAPAKA